MLEKITKYLMQYKAFFLNTENELQNNEHELYNFKEKFLFSSVLFKIDY